MTFQSGGLSTEAFKQALQESVNFPLRPYVLPFLKSHIPILKRDLANLAKASNQVWRMCAMKSQKKFRSFTNFHYCFIFMQSILQYIRSNEASVFEFVNATAENPSTDIFMPSESARNGSDRHQSLNGNSRLLLKRRTSEGYGLWCDFIHNKREKFVKY